MNKYISALAIAVALSGCSSSSNDDPADGGAGSTATDTGGVAATGGATDGGGAAGGGATGGAVVVDGGPIAPSGGVVGAWLGTNNFGDGVLIVDASNNVHGFAANGAGQFETVFGPASGPIQVFTHRDSDNPASASSFTLAGEPASALTGDPASDTILYNLSAQNDGQQLNNTGPAGDFALTFANGDDLAPLSVASIAGDWTASTSFCAADCNITLNMSFTDAGGVSGSTMFNDFEPLTLSGTVSAADGATQYLNISFIWNEQTRTGVVHFDPRNPNNLLLNTVGLDDPATGANASFSASLNRR